MDVRSAAEVRTNGGEAGSSQGDCSVAPSSDVHFAEAAHTSGSAVDSSPADCSDWARDDCSDSNPADRSDKAALPADHSAAPSSDDHFVPAVHSGDSAAADSAAVDCSEKVAVQAGSSAANLSDDHSGSAAQTDGCPLAGDSYPDGYCQADGYCRSADCYQADDWVAHLAVDFPDAAVLLAACQGAHSPKGAGFPADSPVGSPEDFHRGLLPVWVVPDVPEELASPVAAPPRWRVAFSAILAAESERRAAAPRSARA